MRKIFAIGGGNLATQDTLAIDKKIVEAAKIAKPRVLFIPTASNDSEEQCKQFEALYSEGLGCIVDFLFLVKEEPDISEIAQKINTAHIIYAGDGNGLMMLRKWRFTGTDKFLKRAMNSGKVMAGIGAGALCWFEYGHSDSMSYYQDNKPIDNEWNFIRVKSLRLVDRFTFCPAYENENRQASFQAMIKKMGGIGIGVTSNCALQIEGNQFRIIRADEEAKVYKIFKTRIKSIQRPILTNGSWQNIGFLRSKV